MCKERAAEFYVMKNVIQAQPRPKGDCPICFLPLLLPLPPLMNVNILYDGMLAAK